MDPDQALVAIFGSQSAVDTVYQSLCRSISSIQGASPDVVIALFAARSAAVQQQAASAEQLQEAEQDA